MKIWKPLGGSHQHQHPVESSTIGSRQRKKKPTTEKGKTRRQGATPIRKAASDERFNKKINVPFLRRTTGELI
jgi:hypothetical protein